MVLGCGWGAAKSFQVNRIQGSTPCETAALGECGASSFLPKEMDATVALPDCSHTVALSQDPLLRVGNLGLMVCAR